MQCAGVLHDRAVRDLEQRQAHVQYYGTTEE